MTVVTVATTALLSLAALLAVVRIVRGPSLLDRIVAGDVLLAAVVAGIGAEAALGRNSTLLPILVVLSVVSFIAPVTVIRFAVRERP